MTQTKTVAEIKGKYAELIDCLAPNRSNYAADVRKLAQDCKEELHARYDTLIGELADAIKDIKFVGELEHKLCFDIPLLWEECELNSKNINELISILRPNE